MAKADKEKDKENEKQAGTPWGKLAVAGFVGYCVGEVMHKSPSSNSTPDNTDNTGNTPPTKDASATNVSSTADVPSGSAQAGPSWMNNSTQGLDAGNSLGGADLAGVGDAPDMPDIPDLPSVGF
jgi:hypothetical protein